MQQEIEAARRAAVDVARTTPTARDAVSLEAFALLAQKADDGPGSFTAAVDAARRNRFLPIFEPLEIAGLPTVDIMSGPQVQTCTTSVGTADGQSLDLDSSVGGGLDGIRDGDPCAEGHRVAEEIISTLPPR